LASGRRGQLVAHQLHRQQRLWVTEALLQQVAGAVHQAHAAGAEQAFQAVAPGEHVGDRRQRPHGRGRRRLRAALAAPLAPRAGAGGLGSLAWVNAK
jgi:hypothetical protein